MTDAELITFIGADGEPKAQAVIDKLAPAKRRLYERMASLETEASLWQDGFGPRPEGALIDYQRKAFR